jgi:protein phosphatase
MLADSDLRLYIVADGMGGHAGGATASRIAVQTIRKKVLAACKDSGLFGKGSSPGESAEILGLLDESIRTASDRIFNMSERDPKLAGMGTTVTLMLANGWRNYVAHVGDSRLYLMRGDNLEQLTEDHSLVNEQIKAGFITPEEALHSRFRNIITRSVGFERTVKVDTFSLEVCPGDVFLLCSDGLSGMVTDEQVKHIMVKQKLSSAAAQLVTLANRHGGEDNITVVLVRCSPNL